MTWGRENHCRLKATSVPPSSSGGTERKWLVGAVCTSVFKSSSMFAAISLALLNCPVAALPTRLWTSSTSYTLHLMTSSTTMMSTKWKPLETLVSHLHVTWRGVKYIVNILAHTQNVKPCYHRDATSRNVQECFTIWWCRHGGVWSSTWKRHPARFWDCQHGSGPCRCLSHLQDPTQTQHPASDPGWDTLRYTRTHTAHHR